MPSELGSWGFSPEFGTFRHTSGILSILRRNAPFFGKDPGLMTYYDNIGLTTWQRDQLIVLLRRRGFTYRQIAGRVGMSPSGVLRALQRIGQGRPGRA